MQKLVQWKHPLRHWCAASFMCCVIDVPPALSTACLPFRALQRITQVFLTCYEMTHSHMQHAFSHSTHLRVAHVREPIAAHDTSGFVKHTLSLPQTSRANPVQCYSTHQDQRFCEAYPKPNRKVANKSIYIYNKSKPTKVVDYRFQYTEFLKAFRDHTE